MLEPLEDLVDRRQRLQLDVGLDLALGGEGEASAMSSRVPTNEPRMVMQFATTSKSGTGNSPGGRPTRTQVPRLRVMPTPCLNAGERGRGDQNAMRAAAGLLLQRLPPGRRSWR